MAKSLPAIAGGPAAFDHLLPIASPEGLPGNEFQKEIEAILASGKITNSVRVEKLEQLASAFLGVPHCVAVSSCTSGLLLTLRALELCGEVILPSFTFFATAHSILWNGLKPVFADCDPETFCLCPKSAQERLTRDTVAIMAVHMYGNPVDIATLESIVAERGLALVLDSAHAFGSEWQGERVGKFGTAEVFSMSPTKLIVAGEGGLVTTRDEYLARAIRAGRNYGDAGTYDPELLGLSARMSEFHAALAVASLSNIEERIKRRNEIRLRYERNLGSVPGLCFQQIDDRNLSTCKDFSILIGSAGFGASRDWLFDALRRENIEVRRYFWPPVHRQQLYRKQWDGKPLPITDSISDGVISLPIYSSLTDDQVDRVCSAIEQLHVYAITHGVGDSKLR